MATKNTKRHKKKGATEGTEKRKGIRTAFSAFLTLCTLCPLWLLLLPCTSTGQVEQTGYKPVTPAKAVHAALKSSLETVKNWVDDKDFVSAAKDVQGVMALAHLHARQGSNEDFRTGAKVLGEAASRLAVAVKSKDGAACGKQLELCGKLLNELAEKQPGPATLVKDFKPQGNTRVWMLLLDSAYSDAKSARDAREMEQLAQVIAEEMNATAHLRADARWRRLSVEVRDAALAVADRTRGNDLQAARLALKTVYQRCEACHDTLRK